MNWERRRMTVQAAEAGHHAAKGVQAVPLPQEPLPYWRAVFDGRDPDVTQVITRNLMKASDVFTDAIAFDSEQQEDEPVQDSNL